MADAPFRGIIHSIEGKEKTMAAESEARGVTTAAGRGADAGVSWRRLPLATVAAALAASAANAVVFFVASGAGFIPRDALVPAAGGEAPITVGMVAASSVAGALGAAVVFAVIGLFARRPVRMFRIASVAALAVSLAMPLKIPGVPASMIASLEAMHRVAWAVIVGILTTLARKGETR
jgi:disulfide bond formation protein DsbB